MVDVLSDDYNNQSKDVLSDEYHQSEKTAKPYYPRQEPINLLERFKRAGGILESDVGKIPKALTKYVNLGLTEGPGVLKQNITNPQRAIRNIGYGIGETVKESMSNLNTVPPFVKYLAHLGLIPEPNQERFGQEISNPLKHLKPEGKTSGDIYLQNAQKLLPFISGEPIPGGKQLKNIAGGVSRGLLGESPTELNIKSNLLIPQIKVAEEEARAAEAAAREQEKSHAEVIGEAQRKTSKTNPNAMEFALNEQKENIKKAQEKEKELTENLQNIEPEPEEPMAPEQKALTEPQAPNITAPEEPLKTSEQKTKESEKAAEDLQKMEDMLYEAKEHHANAKKMNEKANETIGEHLALGKAHHLHVGRFLKKEMENIEIEGKSKFAKLKKDIKNNKFEMPNMIPFKIDMEDVIRQLNAGKDPQKLNSPAFDNPFLKELIKEAPTSKDKMASDFITKYQDWRDARYKLISDVKFAKSAEERGQMFEAIKNSEELNSIIKKTLDDGLGPFKKDWDKVNNIYSKVIYPLRENSVARKANKTGKISTKDMAEQLSGDESGHAILREMVKSNPKALQHVVGQRYEAGANNVHYPNEILTEYTEKMPQLQSMLEAKKATESLKTNAATHLENTKKQHENAKRRESRLSNAAVRARKEETRAFKEYQERKKAYDRDISSYEKAKKEYEKDIKEAEKEQKTHTVNVEKHEKAVKDREIKIKKAEKAIEEHKKDIERMEKRAELLEDQMHKVREEGFKKKNNLEQVFKANQKLKDLKKELQEINKELSDSTTGLKKGILHIKTLYQIGLKVIGR